MYYLRFGKYTSINAKTSASHNVCIISGLAVLAFIPTGVTYVVVCLYIVSLDLGFAAGVSKF